MTIALSPRWRKATASQPTEACVEIAHLPGAVGIRDSKTSPTGPILRLPAPALPALLEHLTPDDRRLASA
ncbi:DUF397 domain-containing protein [Actinokineospora cianjurensis]|uniref:Uncharacterized protein DUF397 n=1 Tax=Actinokineospora cianjurensis TaxID=585224 RepID=A0A421B220_9PSEU|nr:DUF397 domain-containing protein [Actinokineospora cianjurensis]RLK58392.1 uncharacterized protein DUF397 [Actinokineospora cianjurensis]